MGHGRLAETGMKGNMINKTNKPLLKPGTDSSVQRPPSVPGFFQHLSSAEAGRTFARGVRRLFFKRFIGAILLSIFTFFEVTLTGKAAWAWRLAERSESSGMICFAPKEGGFF